MNIIKYSTYSNSRYYQVQILIINDKTLVVRASCPHKVYLTQAEPTGS
ncbi:hypothetical protein H6F39_06685 [Anabaena sp. FACHB-1250]|nr:hypothetical protein [Anabaena sp. FACHB-1391]MBD2141074.1 hypothetical protein [Anabaena sp. FACHB-1250]MBD2141075.1 hypothetical protein [Anabaena sp. FACHB-1250]MBD2267663.1 hypothetical protein [Anabaena sp. FACHB-1391]MBD2267664.1 hypothetical protein [Anabaena sp. FACHB-1391]